MIKDIFYNYKMKYLKYIILIKSGNFYIALGDDAKIINNILGYQIKEFSNTVKIGFPIISLNKVLDKLDTLKINYMIIDKNVDLIINHTPFSKKTVQNYRKISIIKVLLKYITST